MSEFFTKTTGWFRSKGLAPGDSNPPRYHKYLEYLELGGVMSGYDDSMALRESVAPQVHECLKRWHLSVGREQSQGAEDNMKRDRMMLVATAMVAVFFLLTLGTPLVSANTITTITSTITFGNKALAGQTPPFGTVTVTVTGGKATVTFTALNSYLFGAVNAVDLNLTKAGITAKNFTWTGGNGKTAFFSAGSGNVSGFGRFNLTIDAFDGFKSAVKSVTFTLSGMWANASSVLKINKKGYDAAAHIFANGGKISGFAAEKPSAAVPDGGVTLMLLGGALVGIETLRRRLRV